MTLRPLPRSRLDGLVPPLVQEHALVALVSGTGEDRWAADAAWAVARAALAGGRQVALVDLWVSEPQLHRGAGLDAVSRGIVDVFEQNSELTAAAHDVGGVYFVPAGTGSAAPEFVLAHPRWKKLHAGFRAQNALLMVYVPAGALASLSVVPDGVIVLAPGGFDLESPLARDVRAAQVDGAMLLGCVRDRWTPPPMAVPAEAHLPLPASPPRPGAPRRGRRLALTAAVVVLVAGAAGAIAVLRTGAAPSTPAAASAPAALPTAAPATAAPPAATPPPAPAADTLAWVVQLAAYTNVGNALTHADELVSAGTPALVAPITTGRRATVWYRVLAGGWTSEGGARAGRDSLWARGLARRGEGDLLWAPLTLALESETDAAVLRGRGIPAVSAGGRLAVGAFESADQAAYAREQLSQAGVTAELIVRLERTP